MDAHFDSFPHVLWYVAKIAAGAIPTGDCLAGLSQSTSGGHLLARSDYLITTYSNSVTTCRKTRLQLQNQDLRGTSRLRA
jgi:hypothetical protein